MATSTPSLGAELHALVSLVDRAAARVLGPDGDLSYRRYVVLAGIAQLGGPTQHALAVHLGLSDPAVSRMLAHLVEAGLVTTGPDPAHRRRNTVRLTATGVEVERRIGRRLDDAMSAMLRGVGVEEGVFAGEVQRVRAGFRSWLDDADPAEEAAS